MNYFDFDLEISPGDEGDYTVSVIDSPAGEARETVRFPFSELELENRIQAVQIALLRSSEKRRRILDSHEQTVQEFGRRLFDLLLTGEVRTRYDVSLREATRQEMGLRLRLRIRSPELAMVPWEFMYDLRQGEYVCLSRSSPIVRYLEAQQPIQPLAVRLPLRILAMVAAPTDLAALDVAQEKARAEAALEPLRHQGLVELTWVEGQTWRDLQRALQGGPWHIFHFIGHGGFDRHADEGLIALADEAGKSQFLNATQFGRLLVDHSSLRLVLLNSCEGAQSGTRDLFAGSATTLVRRGMPAVIAMQFEISDRAAIEFAHAFYTALASDIPVDGAVAEARKAVSIALANTVEWGTPVLFLRAADGKIFDVTSSRALAAPGPPRDHPAATAHEALEAGAEPTPGEPIPPRQQAGVAAPLPTIATRPQARRRRRARPWRAMFAIMLLSALTLGAWFWRYGKPAPVAAAGMARVDAGYYPLGNGPSRMLPAFWIDRHEVTNAQFAQFLGRHPAMLAQIAHLVFNIEVPQPIGWVDGVIPPGLAEHPVRGIGWQTAADYCAWMGKRLPAEAEWEAAARGPYGWLYPWGNDEGSAPLPYDSTYVVGSIPTNRSYFGVYDMAGNVWEWVADPYSPIQAGQQVLRGGAYDLRYDMKSPMIGLTHQASYHASLINTGIRCAADDARVEARPDTALLALDDQFTYTGTGWPTVHENMFIVNYHPPDYYHVESRQADGFVTAFYERASFANFILETEVFVDAANTDHARGQFEYGLAVRHNDDQFYAFVVSANESVWRIYSGRLASGSYTGPLSDLRLIATGREDAIQGATQEAVDRLALTTNGPEWLFAVAGKLVQTFTTNDYRAGQVGFVVITHADVTKVHIHYRWVTVQKIEPF